MPEGDVIDPLPIYTPGFESYQDPLNKQYPLQLTGFHYNLAFTQLTATLMC
ncbi:hypothetical protein ACLK2F_05080 [Escherichia coli]